jgi:hypothetical protein
VVSSRGLKTKSPSHILLLLCNFHSTGDSKYGLWLAVNLSTSFNTQF